VTVRRVVVTGAAGFIGSHLCDALLAEGNTVVGVDCFTDFYARSDKEANLASARADDAFTMVEADLRTAELAPIVAEADVVVNLAATPGLTLAWDDLSDYQSCNVNAVYRLVDACLAASVPHVIHASTSSVYGSEAFGPESAPRHPISPYGVTKLAAEEILLAHRETRGLPVTILRYFSIYGPRQRPDMAFRVFCEQLLAGEAITVYGDGNQTRSNTYVSDCVSATMAAMERPPDDLGVFNIGGGREVRLLDAIQILAAELDVEPRIDFRPARRGDQRHTRADTTRARADLGWKAMVRPEEGLAAEVAWVRARAEQVERLRG
jgi:nucleoside-diphosphate-sugar epimerase